MWNVRAAVGDFKTVQYCGPPALRPVLVSGAARLAQGALGGARAQTVTLLSEQAGGAPSHYARTALQHEIPIPFHFSHLEVVAVAVFYLGVEGEAGRWTISTGSVDCMARLAPRGHEDDV